MSEPKKLGDILAVALMRGASPKNPFGLKRETRRICHACGQATRGERFCEECTTKHKEKT